MPITFFPSMHLQAWVGLRTSSREVFISVGKQAAMAMWQGSKADRAPNSICELAPDLAPAGC